MTMFNRDLSLNQMGRLYQYHVQIAKSEIAREYSL